MPKDKKLDLQRRLAGTTWTRNAEKDPAAVQIRNLLEAAGRAQPNNIHVAEDGYTTHVDSRMSGRAAARGELSVRELPNALATVRSTDASGSHNILTTAILEQSRVHRAGARLIGMPAGKTVDYGDVPAMYAAPAEFVSLEPGAMTQVDPSGTNQSLPAQLTAAAWPAKTTAIDRDTFGQFGIRYEVKRSDFRDKGIDRIAAELLTGIAGALARAADSVLLAALEAETLTAFSLAAAAASGAQYDDLRGIIGTGGKGALTTASGQLQIASDSTTGFGPAAEFSVDTAKTIVGDWSKSAIAVDHSITLLAERLNVDGSVALTAWVDLLAVIADASRFWEVV